jgi:hypothetical protein
MFRNLLGKGRVMLIVTPYRVGARVAWLLQSLATTTITQHLGNP